MDGFIYFRWQAGWLLFFSGGGGGKKVEEGRKEEGGYHRSGEIFGHSNIFHGLGLIDICPVPVP